MADLIFFLTKIIAIFCLSFEFIDAIMALYALLILFDLLHDDLLKVDGLATDLAYVDNRAIIGNRL